MNEPIINSRQVNPDATTTFAGLDRRLTCPDGQFMDMQNLTGDEYPLLSPRAKRGNTYYDSVSTMTPVDMLYNGEIIKAMACVHNGEIPEGWENITELTVSRAHTSTSDYLYVEEDLPDTEECNVYCEILSENILKNAIWSARKVTDSGVESQIIDLAERISDTIDVDTKIDVKSGAYITFYDSGYNELRRVYIGGSSDNTHLIPQAGNLYVFPQGKKISLMTDFEEAEELFADVHIVNETDPTSGGGYFSDPALTIAAGTNFHYNSTSIDDSLSSVYLYSKANRTPWDNKLRFKQNGSVYVLGVVDSSSDNETICEVVRMQYIAASTNPPPNTMWEYLTGNIQTDKYPSGAMLLTVRGTNKILCNQTINVGDRIVFKKNAAVLTGTFEVYKPVATPQANMVFTPCDTDGEAICAGEKARIGADSVNETLTANKSVIYTYSVDASKITFSIAATIIKIAEGGDVIENITFTPTTPTPSTEVDIPVGGYLLCGNGTKATELNNIKANDFIYINPDRLTNSKPYTSILVYARREDFVVTSKPQDPVDGIRWYNKDKKQLYIYANNMWTQSANMYFKIDLEKLAIIIGGVSTLPKVVITDNGKTIENWFSPLKDGDCISLEGFGDRDGSYIIRQIIDDKIILYGNIPIPEKHSISPGGGEVTVKRIAPQLDFVIECGNRLWGCHYGTTKDQQVVNEIYASALGDPTNWYKFQGISTDSWAATVGVPGKFTGACKFGDYPLFFKEDAIIRVFGSLPSSFQTACYRYRGVKDGSHKSIAVVDEVLFYHSLDGVLAFTGGMPQKADAVLGRTKYRDAIAGELDGKYIVSMVDEANGERNLFVFDTRIQTWHREDNLNVREIVNDSGTLYYVLNDGAVITAYGGTENDVKWFAETGEYGFGDIYKKRLEKVRLRIKLPMASKLIIQCSYDDMPWEDVSVIEGGEDEIQSISFIPRRCERFRMRYAGIGDCKIITVYRETSNGGDGK